MLRWATSRLKDRRVAFQALESELGVAVANPVGPKDAAILRGAAAVGIGDAAVIRRNADCGACGSCGFGCRRGTKASGLRVHLARAHAAGARIVAEAEIERVLVEAGRAVGATAFVRSGGAGDGGPGGTEASGAPTALRLEVRARQHGACGSGPGIASLRPTRAGPRRREGRERGRGGTLRRRRVALPDGNGGQPDDHDHGPRAERGEDGAGGDARRHLTETRGRSVAGPELQAGRVRAEARAAFQGDEPPALRSPRPPPRVEAARARGRVSRR